MFDWHVGQFALRNEKFPAVRLPQGKQVQLFTVLPPKQKITSILGCENTANTFSERL
jgi:hypothetical protein